MDRHLRARLQAACGLLALALSSACGGAEEEVGSRLTLGAYTTPREAAAWPGTGPWRQD